MIISTLEKKYRGFTLVELLVTIAIVATLAAISVSAILVFRKSADKTVAISNMKQIHTANISYASDHSSRYVSPEETVEGLTVSWWENPEFVSQLKSVEATYEAGGTTNVDLPITLMDPAVASEREIGFDKLAGSYAYNTEGMSAPEGGGAKRGYTLSLVDDPGRTAAFITADFSALGVVNHATAGNISYRHDEKAIVVFYDGHASTITKAKVSGAQGGATGAFWDANPNDN
tara:strand:- start:514 stop:1209 length:696 start_codon:yes stop_codon:yes gene_type:complete